jgi:hypothetical protein
VLNLCTNAYQAIGERSGRIEVRLETVDVDAVIARTLGADARPGRYACLTVADDGPGIAENARERMFEPFFSTKETRGGSGLGLAVVHGIVTDHGGFVRVDSQPGRGARFEVYLPIYDATENSERSTAAARATSTLAEFARVQARSAVEAAAMRLSGHAASPQSTDGARAVESAAPAIARDVPPLDAALPDASDTASLEDLVASFNAVERSNGGDRSVQAASAGALVPRNRPSAPAVARPRASGADRAQRALPQPSAGNGTRQIGGPAAGAPALPPPAHTEEETLLERLVADFLAGENGARASVPTEGGDGAPAGEHTTLPARIGSGLPATQGQRSPARARLIDRAPELQRGHVKLLGSDRPRRLAQDSTAKLPRPSDRALPKPPAAEEAPAERPASPKLSFPFMLG